MESSNSLFQRFRKNNTSDDIWIRQLILAENAKEEARINIENKLVSLSTINY
jgi:hypothetical protein